MSSKVKQFSIWCDTANDYWVVLKHDPNIGEQVVFKFNSYESAVDLKINLESLFGVFVK
jgi:hypothetical protein